MFLFPLEFRMNINAGSHYLLFGKVWPEARRTPGICSRQQFNAVGWTDGNAEPASGAFPGNHSMHQLVGTDNAIRWESLQAKFAANALDLRDLGHFLPFLTPVRFIEGDYRTIQQCCQRRDRDSSSRWALVDFCMSVGDGLCIFPTARIATKRTLRLRQALVNLICGDG